MQDDTAAHVALGTVPIGDDVFVYWHNEGTGTQPKWRLFVQTKDAQTGAILAELSIHENDAATLAEIILRHAVNGPFPLTDTINIR
jgi:hypothetical protein